MKIQNWPTLLVTIFAGGAMCTFWIKDALGGDRFSYLWCILILYIVFKGLYVSLSKEGYEKEQKRAARAKHIYRKLFGQFAPVMPYGAVILTLFSGICAILLPVQVWLMLLFLMLALVYSICMTIVFRKHIKIEKGQEEETE